MKTKMKRQGSTELPRFAVGALAIAGASAANAATVQITFNNSYVSTTGVNTLFGDFGGDGVADLDSSVDMLGVWVTARGAQEGAARAYGFSSSSDGRRFALAWVGSNTVSSTFFYGVSVTMRSLVAVAFSDANIRNGATTNGWLDITAVATQPGEKRLTVNRLIFDDASATAPTGLTSASTGIAAWSAVPEPSSLCLLALGAGGLLARRRRAMAA